MLERFAFVVYWVACFIAACWVTFWAVLWIFDPGSHMVSATIFLLLYAFGSWLIGRTILYILTAK